MVPRILTFTSLFPNAAQPMHGLFVRERVRALSKVCAIEVVAPVPWHRRVDEVERDECGFTVHHPRFFFIPKILKSLDGLFMAASCVSKVAQVREAYPFDLIDAHWAYPDGMAAALIATRLRVPFAVTVRGDDINIFAEERGRGAVIRWMLRRAALVVAVSDELKARVERITGGHPNVTVIRNGVNGDRFHPCDRDAARRRLGLDPMTRVCVSVGRLHASKGLPVLVDALARLPDPSHDVHLFVIGAPDPEADAREAIADRVAHHRLHGRVHLVGPQTPDRLADWYNAADLFCSATTREGSPNVLLEAMACGLPCVTTPVGGNREAVSTSELGLLAPPDAAALGGAIAEALARTWNRQRIAEQARRRTWAVVAEECRDHLLQLVPAVS